MFHIVAALKDLLDHWHVALGDPTGHKKGAFDVELIEQIQEQRNAHARLVAAHRERNRVVNIAEHP